MTVTLVNLRLFLDYFAWHGHMARVQSLPPSPVNSSYCSYQWSDMQTRQFYFVLTLSSRLCAFLIKGIFDSGQNSNDSYFGYINLHKFGSSSFPLSPPPPPQLKQLSYMYLPM